MVANLSSEINPKALEELYRAIAGSFKNNYDIISSYSKYFYQLLGFRHEGTLNVISISVRFIIAIAFIIDIFYFYQLNYFYKSLFLLCILLIINMGIFIVQDFASNLEHMADYLIITEQGYNPITNEPITNF